MRTGLLLLPFFFFGHASADWWDDFSNNLATDIAPILALFGEQVTKQFLSESTTLLDNFIFAMVPMGILTAVVSAIRVCGGSNFRAFIGRAQEGSGVAEAELCSSTSRDVCELYHNGSIARVFGRPKILEVVYDRDCDSRSHNGETESCGIFPFEEYITSSPGKAKWKEDHELISRGDIEAPKHSHKQTDFGSEGMLFAPNPNLSLNIGIKKTPRGLFWLAATTGLALQLAVFVFGAVATFKGQWEKNGSVPPGWAFWLMVSGTLLQCAGMFFCALLIERSTKERVFRRDMKAGACHASLYVLQPGNQVVGDQTFDSFSFATDPKHPLVEYTTSWKDPQHSTAPWRVSLSVGSTLLGFVAQFVGLRSLHSSVSVFQLGAILSMSLIRSMLRTQRLGKGENQLQDRPDQVLGYELDWLAMQIGECDIGDADDRLLWSIVATSVPQLTHKEDMIKQYGATTPEGAKDDAGDAVTASSEDFAGAAGDAVIGSVKDVESLESTGSTSNVTETGDVAITTNKGHAEGISSNGSPKCTGGIHVSEHRDNSRDRATITNYSPPMVGAKGSTSQASIKSEHAKGLRAGTCTPDSKLSDLKRDSNQRNCPARIFQYRARLAQLTTQSDLARPGLSNAWGDQFVRVRHQARQLKKAIETSADIIFSNAEIRESFKNARQFTWSLNAQHCLRAGVGVGLPDQACQPNQSREIRLSLNRFPTDDKQLSKWQADQHSLEAVIGLWTWSMTSDPLKERQDGFGQTVSEAEAVSTERILAMEAGREGIQRAKMALRCWMGEFPSLASDRTWTPELACRMKTASTIWVKRNDGTLDQLSRKEDQRPQIRLFGWQTTQTKEQRSLTDSINLFALTHPVNHPLATLCAQDVYLSFICSIATAIDSIGGTAERRDISTNTDYYFAHKNVLSKLVDSFEQSGLGTRQDAYFLIFPALRSQSKLHFPRHVLATEIRGMWYRREQTRRMKRQEFEASEKELKYLFDVMLGSAASYLESPEGPGLDTVMMELGELYRPGLGTNDSRKVKLSRDGIKWISQSMKTLTLPAAVQDIAKRYSQLMDRGAYNDPPATEAQIIQAIVENDRVETLWLLNQDGVELTSSDSGTRTVLSWAAQQGWREVVAAALKLGSSPDAKDSFHRSALSYASENGQYSVIAHLLRAGTNPMAVDRDGRAAISYAAAAGSVATLQALLKDDKVYLSTRDRTGRSPLHWAAETGQLAALRLILKEDGIWSSKDTAATSEGALTPLISALVNKHTDIAKLLINSGADWKIKVEGQDAWRWAVRNGHWTCAEILLECFRQRLEEKTGSSAGGDNITVVIQVEPGQSRNGFKCHNLVGRGGILLRQLDLNGEEVEMTKEIRVLLDNLDYRSSVYAMGPNELEMQPIELGHLAMQRFWEYWLASRVQPSST